MTKIVRVEWLMVDLIPKVKRVDAIQSVISQQTPIVRITDAEGGVGTGYSYTIGTGGHSVVALIGRTLAPAILGCDADDIEAIWRHLLFLTPRHHRRADHRDRDGGDRYSVAGFAQPAHRHPAAQAAPPRIHCAIGQQAA